ncbi:hypothetical protein AWJ20_5063 [Sugiyamaella lignohabitans]|uniref:NYN domain-containing protein n=1 Tax=Sugiyamaella lignohabitans TaxID=796027 RepID=A0A167EHY3_9ASCO|nr:uncharacterized protein AWJ20_5063 [Sugiyamaella lignohabitans]ANB14105.1 hypothetical protein AWJ20_5063 [Sugiyamaella lignohabitans]
MFPADRKTLAVPRYIDGNASTSSRSNVSRPLHVFVDWSNIYISFKSITDLKRPPDISALDLVLLRGREFTSKTLASSDLPSEFQAKLKDLRYKVYSVSRQLHSDNINSTAKLKEHGVDEILSQRVTEAVKNHQQGVIVLATGDGSMSSLNREVGFIASIETALTRGWIVELYSFYESLSSNYQHLQQQYPRRMFIFILDNVLGDL